METYPHSNSIMVFKQGAVKNMFPMIFLTNAFINQLAPKPMTINTIGFLNKNVFDWWEFALESKKEKFYLSTLASFK